MTDTFLSARWENLIMANRQSLGQFKYSNFWKNTHATGISQITKTAVYIKVLIIFSIQIHPFFVN